MSYTPAELQQMELWDQEEKIEYLGALLGTDPSPTFPMQTTSATKAVDPAAAAQAAAQQSAQSQNNGGTNDGTA
jgi:hypothetical protein